MKITIVGAGAMGAALSIPFAKCPHSVTLCGTELDREEVESLMRGEPHSDLRLRLPASVAICSFDGIGPALAEAELVVLAVSSRGVLPVMEAILPHLDKPAGLMTLAKGFIEVAGEALPVAAAIRVFAGQHDAGQLPPLLCLAGPSIAAEVAREVPTFIQIAGEQASLAREVSGALSSDYFHCRPCPDLFGLELCSAYKNIYAIALSWPDGLAETGTATSTNLKAILFLQALEELKWLALAGDGEPETVLGMAGLGDLITTAGRGRNGRFGKLLGSGKSVEEALRDMKAEGIETIEGYQAAGLGLRYARQINPSLGERLLLLRRIGEVLFEGKTVEDAVQSLDLSQLIQMEDCK